MENKIRDKIKNIWSNTTTLEERYNLKENSFDILRIFFAIFVIIAHGFVLFYGSAEKDVILQKFLKDETLGGVAVIGFFIISGFMITQSILHSNNIKEFLIKRVIRIYPALIVMLLITVFVIGPMVYNNVSVEYFKNESVWSYLKDNINLFGNTNYNISGIFEGNPYKAAINGSIWSLKHEFMLYFVIAFMYLCNVLKNKRIMLGTTIFLIFIYFLGMEFNPSYNFMNNIGVINEFEYFIKLSTCFFIGATIYLYKDRIKMSFPIFIFFVVVLLFGIVMNGIKYVLILAFPYIVMYIGTHKPKKNYLGKVGDFSYGLYIYAFPIQQTLMYFIGGYLNVITFDILTILITSVIAILSTCLIDNNVKKLKNRKFFLKEVKEV